LSRAWGGEGKRVSGLLEPLSGLLMQGEVELSAMPVEEPGERAEVLALLREAYWHYQLDLAGPRLPFAGATALAAASWCLAACWFVVSRQEPDEFVERTLDWQPQLRDAADHLAADLTLRYLPRVLQRARLLGREDGLVRAIARLAGRVPLSGVLLDVPPGQAEIPTTLGDHAGLHLLYAERFAANPRAEWLPAGGPLRQMCAVVLARQQRALPMPVEPSGAAVADAEAVAEEQSDSTRREDG
jgi:hypothetical protein